MLAGHLGWVFSPAQRLATFRTWHAFAAGAFSALLARTKSVLDPLDDAVKHMALL